MLEPAELHRLLVERREHDAMHLALARGARHALEPLNHPASGRRIRAPRGERLLVEARNDLHLLDGQKSRVAEYLDVGRSMGLGPREQSGRELRADAVRVADEEGQPGLAHLPICL
jgi:hypothetical protein